MSQVRSRRAVRSTVLVAAAVLASFVTAPAAQADAGEVTSPPVADGTGSLDAPPSAPAPSDPGAPTSTVGSDPSAAPVDPSPVEPAPAPTDEPTPTAVGGLGDVVTGDTVVGELVQAWPDPVAEDHDHDHDGPLSWIEPAQGEAVRVPTDSLPDVAVGSTLAVTVGEEVVDEASSDLGIAPAVEVQAATVLDVAAPDPTTASAGSAPTNTVTAVLVQPAGTTRDGTTIGTVVDTINGAVNSFWDEQSNGTVRIAAVQGAAGWITSTQSCASPSSLWDDVARQIGWRDGAGKHLMLYVPSNASGCAYGLGTVGSSVGSGGRSYVRATALAVMAHELGHNFGLGHSSEYQCDSAVESGSCRVAAYNDYYDVMGFSWSQVGSLNTVQAARLGLLPSSEQVSFGGSSPAATVELAPVSATTGTRAITLTSAGRAVYHLEYRAPTGRDGWLRGNVKGLDSGVVLRRVGGGDDTSLLLDGTPSPSSRWDADLQQALPVGTAVRVGEFTVTVTGVDGASASVQVVTSAGTNGRLLAGSRLTAGQAVTSSSGGVRVVVQADGNLVSYGTGGRVLWATYTYSPGASLVMQSDGNAVLYSVDGRVVWHSGTWGNPGATFVVKPDGSSVITTTAGREIWGTPGDSANLLSAGQRLTAYQYLESATGQVKLVMQPDGNLVSYGTGGRVLWATGTYSPGASLVMQPDGNTVLYAADGRVLWHTYTWGNAGAAMVVRPEGAVVVTAADGAAIWGTVADTPSQLLPGQVLYADQYVSSPDGSVRVVMQGDGNLVGYGPGARVLWATYTYSPGARLTMQSDGNAVIYGAAGQVVWHSGTWGHAGNRLVTKTDGSTVVVSPAGREFWGTRGI